MKISINEIILGMEKELIKQGQAEQPDLVKAAECLHTALEILEDQGLQKRADQVLSLLDKIGKQSVSIEKSAKIHSLHQLMEAGVSQRDLREFARGNPIATAKINLVLRKLGLSDHEIAKFLGPNKVLSEEDAHKTLNPNQAPSFLEFKSLSPEAEPVDGPSDELLEFQSIAFRKKHKKTKTTKSARHTKGLTPEKMVKNLKEHGHPLNLTDDACAIDVPSPVKNNSLNKEDMYSGFEDLLNASTFDIDASDDELMNMEVTDDSLEVFDKEIPIEDFEDERD